MPSAFANARAIVRALRAARRSGQTPEVIVLDPHLHAQLQDPALGYLWSRRERDVLFGVPVEVDLGAKGWRIRLR